jgi:hypothetical protein
MQDLLQEELHEDDLEQVKQSAQGLGVEVRHNLHLPISCFNTLATGASLPVPAVQWWIMFVRHPNGAKPTMAMPRMQQHHRLCC